MLGIMQFVMYFSSPVDAGAKTCLFLGVSGVFFLSWVGAICDNDTAPSCQGNGEVHSMLAVAFFVFYDVAILILTMKQHSHNQLRLRSGHTAKDHSLSLLLCLTSILSKFRFALTDTPLAILEWTDVIAMLLWTSHYIVTYCHDIYIGFVDNGPSRYERITDSSKSSSNLVPLISVGTEELTIVTCVLSILTVAMSFVSANNRGMIHPKQVWPMISDLWTAPIGNYLSRWGVMLGATMLALVQVLYYYMSTGGNAPTASQRSLLILSLCSAMGLSIVGCVNENENYTVHIISAYIFLGGYDIYMIGYSKNNKIQWTCTLISVLSKIRFGVLASLLASRGISVGDDRHDTIVAMFEWSDWLAMQVFLIVTVLQNPNAPRYFVGMFRFVGTSGGVMAIQPDAERTPLLHDGDY
jgi:hypothetical membrane protein